MLHNDVRAGVQEVAGNHGVALWGRTEEGFATDPVMVAMHLIFAATRIQIEMTKYPKWYVVACASSKGHAQQL